MLDLQNGLKNLVSFFKNKLLLNTHKMQPLNKVYQTRKLMIHGYRANIHVTNNRIKAEPQTAF